MRRIITLLLLGVFLGGCGGGSFKLPKDEYRERVRTLGVLPLLVDADSAITHPERPAVVDLLYRSSVGKEQPLIERLREEKAYFDVRPVAGDPRGLFGRLVVSSSLRGQGEELYRRYQFSGQAAAQIARDNVVDALLVVVLNGVARPAKRWDRRSLDYLEGEYNEIEATASVVLPSGEIAWELPVRDFLSLQYPDFDEAYWNRSQEVKVKYITAAGLERTLAEQGQGVFGKSPLPQRYEKLLDAIAEALQPGLANPFKGKEAPAPPAKAP